MNGDFTIDLVQKLEFDILKYIKKICEEHSIRYYLAYGSLIGAVRHKGFIPWDDDIDIMMPRSDYQRLLEVVQKNEHPYYKLISVDTDNRFQVPLPKIIDTRTNLIQDYDLIEPVPLGVYVDIFLIDGAGDDYENALLRYNRALRNYQTWKKSRQKMFPPNVSRIKSILRRIKNLPFIILGSSYFMKELTKENSKFTFDSSYYVATFETGTSIAEKNVFNYSDFAEGNYLEFNGEFFQVPKNYDKLLKLEYGNYMELPPVEQQVSHHAYSLTWNDGYPKP